MADGRYEAPSKAPIVNDSLFDLLRRFVEYIFPALSLLYVGLNKFWGDEAFPNPENIAGTLSLVAVFAAGLLAFLRNAFKKTDLPPGGYDGKVVEDTTEEGLPILRVELDPKATTDIMNKPKIVIKGYDASA